MRKTTGDDLRVIVWLVIIAASALVVCAGCASRPYLDIGTGYMVSGTKAWDDGELVNPRDEPVGRVKIGTQWRNGNYCEWEHSSYVGRGQPFNDKPEYSSDTVYCAWRFGGQ